MSIRVCLAGATGWAGSALARAIVATDDIDLVAGVSRRQAGRSLAQALGPAGAGAATARWADVLLCGSAQKALATPCDVFVEYTQPEIAKANVAAAIARGVHVVIGTSGLSDADLEEIDNLALERQVGVLAAGNFSVATAVLTKCAQLAARYFPAWEIVDYASAGKPDAPSGTARELAYKLGGVRRPEFAVPVAQTQGPVESRGAALNGIQVHSLRLPGYVLAAEVLFGTLDERLTLRYDAGSSPEPYVAGALLAIRRVGSFTGLRRGLDSLLEV